MQKIIRCTESDYVSLAKIWERSVRATHSFLSEESIREIKSALISEYFPNVSLFAIVDNGIFVGFIGLDADKIEMLFIDSNRLRQGYGSALIDFAIQIGATKVDVNEQNREATLFYQTKGFKTVGRDDTDEAGRPYPILHLSL